MASITTKHVSSSRSYAIPRRLLLSYLISLILNNNNILVVSSSSSRPLIRQHLRGRHLPSLERRRRAEQDFEDDYMQLYPDLGEEGGRPMGLTLQEKMKMFTNHKAHGMEDLEDISFEGDDMYEYPTKDDDDDKNEYGDDFEDDVDAIVPEKTEAMAAATVPNPLLGHSSGKTNKNEENGKGKDKGDYEYEYEPYDYENDEVMEEKTLEIAPVVTTEEKTEATMAQETVVANPLHNGKKKKNKENENVDNIDDSDNDGDEVMPPIEMMDESVAIIPENNKKIKSQKVTNPILTHKSGTNKGHKKNDKSIEDGPDNEIDSVSENPEEIETVSESVGKKGKTEVVDNEETKSVGKKEKHSDKVESFENYSDHKVDSIEDDPEEDETPESEYARKKGKGKGNNDASVKEDTDGKKNETVAKKNKGKDNGSTKEDTDQMVKSINIIPEDVETVVSESVVKKGNNKGKNAISVTPEEVKSIVLSKTVTNTNSSSEESSSGETFPSTDEIISIVDEKETIALPESNLNGLEELEGYKLDEERMPIDIKDAKTIADVKDELSDLLDDDDDDEIDTHGNMFGTQDSLDTLLDDDETDVNDNSTLSYESEDDTVADDDLETSFNETLLEDDDDDDSNATEVKTNDTSTDNSTLPFTPPLNDTISSSNETTPDDGDDDDDDDLYSDVDDVLNTTIDSVINVTISLNESSLDDNKLNESLADSEDDGSVAGDDDFLSDDFNSTDQYEENETASFDDDLLTDVNDVLDTTDGSVINMTIPLNISLFDSEDEFLSDDDDVLSDDVDATDINIEDNVTLPTNDVSYNNTNVTNGINTTNGNFTNITIPLNESFYDDDDLLNESFPEDSEDDMIAADANVTDQYNDNITLPINDVSDTNATTAATSNSESSSIDIDLPSPDDDYDYETNIELNVTKASQIPMSSDAPTASPSSSMTSVSSVVVSSLNDHSNVDTETKDDPYIGKWKLKKAYRGEKKHDGQKRKQVEFPKDAVIIISIASNPKEENGYNIKTTIGNSFITQWRIVENKKGYDVIEVDPIVSTRMFPPDEFKELEEFFGRLETFNTITVVDNLYMKGPEAELVCVPYEEDEDET